MEESTQEQEILDKQEDKPVLAQSSPKQVRFAISAFYFMQGVCFASWASRIPTFKASMGLNDAELGSILFALPAGQIITMFFSAKLTTHFGSKKMLRATAPLYAIALTFLALATTGWQLAAFLVLFGITGNLCNIALNTQGVAGENYYGKPIMSSFHGAWSIGNLTGALIALGLVNLKLGMYTHFWIIALISLTNVVFSSKKLLDHNNRPDAPVEKTKFFTMPQGILVLLGVIAFCSMATEGTMFDWSAIYFEDVVKLPHNKAIIGYASFMFMMASGRFLGVFLIGKFGRKNLLQISGAIISIGMALAVIFPEIVVAIFGFMLIGFGVSSIVPMVYSIAGNNKKVPAGKAITMVSSIGYFAFLFGPPLIGYVSQLSSLRYSFGIISVFGLLITFLVTKIKTIN
ncbi:MFS transporter [Pedobacter riviphilus]|uniref:MFS transporter n=1 Tax=Pedobacter riviphilus TaxID=2766984 RepID=A0ABX6TIJ5_9SPHI|nr:MULTISPECIES: MFS transporter [Pedobacter]NMN38144.1 MFS family permease [Pedobacter sp. SG918]QNR84731.1 MFS transporter [Pedobacter riviphilus]